MNQYNMVLKIHIIHNLVIRSKSGEYIRIADTCTYVII